MGEACSAANVFYDNLFLLIYKQELNSKNNKVNVWVSNGAFLIIFLSVSKLFQFHPQIKWRTKFNYAAQSCYCVKVTVIIDHYVFMTDYYSML